ncbi:MAG TPA: hypothetical protein VGK68_04420, partial [Gaiellaceae bacterium]
MNRFFRSALFPLVIIAALVWLAVQTLGHNSGKSVPLTTSQFIHKVTTGQVTSSQQSPVTIDPNKQSISATVATDTGSEQVTVHYATDQSEYSIEQAMRQAPKTVYFNSKGIGSSPWWSILSSLLPFVLLFGFWIFLMNQVQGGGSKVMSFGKSRAKRMTPDAPKIGFKDVAGVD